MKTSYFAPIGGISKIAGNIPLHDFFKVSKKIIEQPINIEMPKVINNDSEIEEVIIPILFVLTVIGIVYYWEKHIDEKNII